MHHCWCGLQSVFRNRGCQSAGLVSFAARSRSYNTPGSGLRAWMLMGELRMNAMY